MIPIAKNVSVIDELGNIHESTYAKRAKGLVKTGRARFVEDTTICLVSVPDKLEDNIMSNNEFNYETNETTTTTVTTEAPVTHLSESLVAQVMAQIAKINDHTDYFDKALKTIADLADTDHAEEQTESIVEMIREREATNRKMLSTLESLLNSSKASNPKLDIINTIAKSNSLGHSNNLIKELIQDL